VGEFPVQPSRTDGLGVMCKPHWTEYTGALRQASKARNAAAADEGAALAAAVDAAIAREAAKGPATREPARKTTTTKRAPTARDIEVQRAEALIAEVDALPGPQAIKRNGDPDVQAAYETVAAANGNGHRETPVGEAIDGGTEAADAA
jgi:hypothetical protein